MNVRVSLKAILPIVTLVLIVADSGFAKTIPARSPKDVKKSCNDSGGVSFPKTGPNSTYGCINEDGSGIVCGGVTAKDKKTCDTFRVIPPRLPTRPEVEYAEAAKTDQGETVKQK